MFRYRSKNCPSRLNKGFIVLLFTLLLNAQSLAGYSNQMRCLCLSNKMYESFFSDIHLKNMTIKVTQESENVTPKEPTHNASLDLVSIVIRVIYYFESVVKKEVKELFCRFISSSGNRQQNESRRKSQDKNECRKVAVECERNDNCNYLPDYNAHYCETMNCEFSDVTTTTADSPTTTTLAIGMTPTTTVNVANVPGVTPINGTTTITTAVNSNASKPTTKIELKDGSRIMRGRSRIMRDGSRIIKGGSVTTTTADSPTTTTLAIGMTPTTTVNVANVPGVTPINGTTTITTAVNSNASKPTTKSFNVDQYSATTNITETPTKKRRSPHYWAGVVTGILFSCLLAIIAVATFFCISRIKKRRDYSEQDRLNTVHVATAVSATSGQPVVSTSPNEVLKPAYTSITDINNRDASTADVNNDNVTRTYINNGRISGGKNVKIKEVVNGAIYEDIDADELRRASCVHFASNGREARKTSPTVCAERNIAGSKDCAVGNTDEYSLETTPGKTPALDLEAGVVSSRVDTNIYSLEINPVGVLTNSQDEGDIVGFILTENELYS